MMFITQLYQFCRCTAHNITSSFQITHRLTITQLILHHRGICSTCSPWRFHLPVMFLNSFPFPLNYVLTVFNGILTSPIYSYVTSLGHTNDSSWYYPQYLEHRCWRMDKFRDHHEDIGHIYSFMRMIFRENTLILDVCWNTPRKRVGHIQFYI